MMAEMFCGGWIGGMVASWRSSMIVTGVWFTH
jgi:hypothetical protein